MNPMQLTMIAAYAQAQQIAGIWGFDVEDEGYYYSNENDGAEWAIFLCDEGYEFQAGSNAPRVPVKNITHLVSLVAGTNSATSQAS